MNAAYVTIYDPADVSAWSGLGFHIARCLELAGVGVTHVGPLRRQWKLAARLGQLEAKLQGCSYAFDRDPRVARAYATEVARRLGSTARDIVFSPGTIPIAYLDTDDHVVFWADATFGAMLRSYPDYLSLSRRSIRAGAALEARALERASVAFYASEWAAHSAIEDHGGQPERIVVLGFGANMAIDYVRDDVARLVRERATDVCRLLFVGVDWSRKGGDHALQAARLLSQRGLPVELDIVGSTPSERVQLPPWVRLHGFVDKTTPDGLESMRRLLRRAHVLIHPARAEAFGVVFCEAAGHGVLSVASRVGGIPSAVREGVTGTLCEPGAPAEAYADAIWQLMEDRTAYEAMALRAFDEYEQALSWEARAVRLKARLAGVA